MKRNMKIAGVCLAITAILCVVVGCVVFLLHNRNSVPDLPETTTEIDTVPEETTARANTPKAPLSTVTEELSITINEDAAGFRQEVMLAGTEDYCKGNNITGDVEIIDAEVDDNGVFSVTIKAESGEYTFSFKLEDYV